MNSKSSSEETEHEPLYRSSYEGHEESEESRPTSFRKRGKEGGSRVSGSRIIAITTYVLNVTLAIACAALALHLRDLKTNLKDLQNHACVFPTDLQDAARHIGYEEKVFTGAIAFKRSTSSVEVYQDIPEGEPRYFGDPDLHPEIDDNWKDLLSSKCAVLTCSASRLPFVLANSTL